MFRPDLVDPADPELVRASSASAAMLYGPVGSVARGRRRRGSPARRRDRGLGPGPRHRDPVAAGQPSRRTDRRPGGAHPRRRAAPVRAVAASRTRPASARLALRRGPPGTGSPRRPRAALPSAHDGSVRDSPSSARTRRARSVSAARRRPMARYRSRDEDPGGHWPYRRSTGTALASGSPPVVRWLLLRTRTRLGRAGRAAIGHRLNPIRGRVPQNSLGVDSAAWRAQSRLRNSSGERSNSRRSMTPCPAPPTARPRS